ncbi:MAG: hypothetical protein JWN17_80 [Frankiales bacterium]|nr:hypothetical protein [Frankiales bacterium]
MAPDESPLERAPDVLFQDLDGEVLVLRPGGQDVLHLNQTASDVWQLLDVASTAAELAELLAEAYDVPVAQVRGDLEPLVELLLERGVVRRRP